MSESNNDRKRLPASMSRLARDLDLSFRVGDVLDAVTEMRATKGQAA